MLVIKDVANYASVKQVADGKLSAIASNPRVDRDGEVILPTAFADHLETYRANPVILAAHTHRSFDGAPTVIGSATSIGIDENALAFEMTFAKTPLAQQWQGLFEDGHVRSFSVGFIPRAGGWKEQDGESVYVHTEVELLEISAVAVPSNPAATVRGTDPAELKRLVAAEVAHCLQRHYAKRMMSLL